MNLISNQNDDDFYSGKSSREDDELITQKLYEFRRMIHVRNQFQCPKSDDYLAAFIRARKYNLEQAYTRLQNTFVAKHKIFNEANLEFSPSAHSNLINQKNISILRTRDNEGRQILYIRPGDWDPSEFSFEEIIAVLYFVIHEATLTSVEIQMKGITVLFNLTGFGGLRHLCQFTVTRCINALNFIQNALPIKIKGIHLTNNHKICSILYSIWKPFLKEKLRRRIFFHGYKFSSLHEFIRPEMLPAALGGFLSHDECVDNAMLEGLLAKDEFFKELGSVNLFCK